MDTASEPALHLEGDPEAALRIILAHGAGAPMDSVLLNAVTRGLVERGVRVGRFEFPYMAARRVDPKRRGPPDRTEVLLDTWRRAFAAMPGKGATFVGGHSMGGRMSTMVADEVGAAGICALAYPWHPPGKPGQTRTAHLANLRTPALLLCGERDTFGTREEVAGYALSAAVHVQWLPEVDHSFRSTRSSGRTLAGNLREAAERMHAFMVDLIQRKPREGA
jgi:predicted alpha/beta-hydrolase family hydrolase